jgi:hypothetical protein
MKTNTLLSWLFLFVALATSAFAAEAVSSGHSTPNDIVQWLTPIIVPIVLAGVKKLFPLVPSGLIPYLAPVLGMLIGVLDTWILGNPLNLVTSAAAGALGVALREMKEAVAKAPNGGWGKE